MRFGCPIINVKDIAVSKNFYEKVLSQQVTLDLGENVAFGTEPVVFAIQHDYAGLVDAEHFCVGEKANDHELYFEEEHFDAFESHLRTFDDIMYINQTKEYEWGQRVIRFYDPDFHIIEVGESMASVFKKFRDQGMSVEEVASRTSYPVDFVRKYIEG